MAMHRTDASVEELAQTLRLIADLRRSSGCQSDPHRQPEPDQPRPPWDPDHAKALPHSNGRLTQGRIPAEIVYGAHKMEAR